MKTSNQKTVELKNRINELKDDYYFVIRISDDLNFDLKNNQTFHGFTYRGEQKDIFEYFSEIMEEVSDKQKSQYIFSLIKEYKDGFALYAHDGLASTKIVNEDGLLNSLENDTFEDFLCKNSWEDNNQRNYVSFNTNDKFEVLYSFKNYCGDNLHLIAVEYINEESPLPADLVEDLKNN